MIEDFFIEENFITEQERLSIKQQVLNFKSFWTSYRPERYSNIDFKTLGNALYIMEDESSSYIDQEIKKLLLENLNWLYKRICDKVYEITGKPTILHPNLTVPGFHIVDKVELVSDDSISFFHNDMSILKYDNESNMETNRSILIPIELPSQGSYLLYKENDEIKKLDYKLGTFHQWDARLDHKVGGLKLLPNEYRITLQSHYYYNTRLQSNLLYF